MYTCKSQNSSHCCGKVFPSATALRSLTRYKHLKKTCKIREKTFKSLAKLKSPKKTIPKGKINLQEIAFLARHSTRPRKGMIGREVYVIKPVTDVKPIDAIEEMGDQHDDEC